ncbi:hypothetical protein TWF694_009457 [Orbilia ellipsospora]|uniref:NACHT domain-containing protein n=1 Tax=Orbilia ellipsospora TaxID=2528407 RepID=A0AAV9XC31_9PEZI
MDGLSAAASVIAVIQVATSVAKVCGQYLKEVKHARNEIEALTKQTEIVIKLLEHTQSLLDGPHKAKLKASRELASSLSNCKTELDSVELRLKQDFALQSANKQKGRFFHRFGSKDFKWPFAKKEVDGIIGRLEKIQQSVDRALQLDQIKVILSVEQQANLSKLLVAEGATFGSFEDENEPECLPDTRTELLENIATWISDPNAKRMYWLSGMAGTGKSTISRTVARTFRDKRQLAASFFFKRGKANRGDASRVFGTIANSLRLHMPELGPDISKAVEDDPDICRKALREQFKSLIYEPLSRNISNNSPIVIIMDALDECEGEDTVKLLLDLLSRLQNLSLDIRIFITSRPEAPINLGFEMLSGDHKDVILQDIQELTIKHDISVFLKHEFAKIQKNRKREVGEDWPGEDRIQNLIEVSVPLFISAATICRFVADRKFPAQERLDAVLKFRSAGFASKLDKTYLPVFEQMIIGANSAELEEISRQFQDIIGLIILLESPLPLSCLSEISGKSDTQLLCTLDQLRSVLNIPDDTHSNSPIQIFHLSFRDFLLDDVNKPHWFWINSKKAHRNIAKNCILLLARTLRQDMCDLKSPGLYLSDISESLINQNIPLEIQYACRYWVHHLKEGYIQDKDPEENHTNIELSTFLYDTKRFIQFNHTIVSQAPLQLYSAALLFASGKSLVRATFSGKTRTWDQKSTDESSWGETMQTLEGSSDDIVDLAFSPDGKLLASVCGVSITIWDTVSGSLIQRFPGNGKFINCIAFSPNDGWLASGSSDGDIKIWNTVSGALIQTFETNTSGSSCLTYSNCGEILVVGSLDDSIQFWNPKTGLLMHTIEGIVHQAEFAVFSSDGNQLAAAGDTTINIWDVRSKTLIRTLEGHSKWVSGAVFSHNGKGLVSTSSDCTLRLWDLSTGKLLHTNVRGEELYIIKVSPNGKLLAIGTYSGFIELRDAYSGELLHTLKGHHDWVKSLSFSPDGNTLASGSCDRTIRIWDVASHYRSCSPEATDLNLNWGSTATSEPTLEAKPLGSNDVSIKLSTDGGRLALSMNRGIHLWDTSSQKLCPSFEANNTSQVFVFSPDGRRLASGSHDDTSIKIWDTDSGNIIRTLYGHPHNVVNLTFSWSEANQLASADDWRIVKLWDIESGKTVRTVEPKEYGELIRETDPEGYAAVMDVEDPYSPSSCEVALSQNKLVWVATKGERYIWILDIVLGTPIQTLRRTSASRWPSLIALSPSGGQLALMPAGSHRGVCIEIWDVTSRAKIRDIPLDLSLSRISFSKDGHVLETNAGNIDIRSADIPPENLQDSREFVTLKDPWVYFNGSRALRLPHDYLPQGEGKRAAFAISGNLLAFARRDGYVMFLRADSLQELWR